MTLTVLPVPGHGTEDVVVQPHGRHEGSVYTGVVDGSILRVSHDGRRIERVAGTGGRPLGIELEPDGRLLVCDARRGLLRVDPGDGRVELVLDRIEGERMRVGHNAAVAADGTVWFSDSSREHSLDRWKDAFVQDLRSGRLVRLDAGGTPEVVLDGLAFANGVALAADESYVAVAETRTRRVVRLWLTGERAGTHDLLVDDLPGYPDNMARGSDGLVWVTISSPVDRFVDAISRGPHWLRRGATRVPERLQPRERRTVHVQAYDDAGRLVHDCSVTSRDFHMVTGVREHEGRVWMGSLEEPALAVLDR